MLKGIGSGSLLAPDTRWYATVQKAEAVHRVQSELADLHAQNLSLKAQMKDMKDKQTAELERSFHKARPHVFTSNYGASHANESLLRTI